MALTTPIAPADAIPGTPSAPTVLFAEDFEHAAPGANTLLTDYTGVSGTTYSADPPWRSRSSCNGLIIDWSSTRAPADCDALGGGPTAFAALQRLSYGLGLVANDADPSENAAVGGFTEGDPGAGHVELETSPLTLPATGRFVTFGVDAAATSCDVPGPRLRFYLRDGSGTETPVSATAINPCTDGEALAVPARGDHDADIYGGRFALNDSRLLPSGSFSVVMRNEEATGEGNDGAFDNIRVLDVTPRLDLSFSPDTLPTGEVSTLTLTVTNTGELGEKVGWAYTDHLPAGLVIAGSAVGGTCQATTVASAGGSTIEVSGGKLDAGQASCTITVPVTSQTPTGAQPSPKTYQNCAADLTGVVGLDLPGCAEVEFHSVPRLALTKTSTATAETRPGDTVGYTLTAKNVGTGDFTTSAPAQVDDDLSGLLDEATYDDDATASPTATGSLSYAQPVLSWSGPLAVGQSVTISYSVTVTGGGDRRLTNLAWAPADPGSPTPPACDPVDQDGADATTGEPCAGTTDPLPGLSITKSADPTSLPAPGQQVTFTVVAGNPGPGDFTASAPATVTDDLADVLDDADLVPGSLTADHGAPPTLTGTTLTWTGPLPAGEAVTIEYTFTYLGDGDHRLINHACVDPALVVAGEQPCAGVTVAAPQISATKSVVADSGTVGAGTLLTYTVTVANTGGAAGPVDYYDDLTHVLDDADVVKEPQAGGLTVSRSGRFVHLTGTLAADSTATAVYVVRVKPDGRRGDDVAANFLARADNAGRPQATPPEPDCASGSGPGTCTRTAIGRLTVTKTAAISDPTPTAGSVASYTLTFASTGRAPVAVAFTDDLTGVLDDAAVSGTPVVSGPGLRVTTVGSRWRITGLLPAGRTVTVDYQVVVNDAGRRGDDVLHNVLAPTGAARVVCGVGPEVSCVDTALSRVLVAKSADPASGTPVTTGQRVTYTLTFTNQGRARAVVDHVDDLTGVLDDATLTGAVHVSGGIVSGGGASGTSLRARVQAGFLRVRGSLAPGETATATYVVTVAGAADRGDSVLANAVSAIDGGCAPLPGASCTTRHPIPRLVAEKSVDTVPGAPVVPGQRLTYTLTFSNTGTAPVPVDAVDDLVDVLDDATLVAPPTAEKGTLRVIRRDTRLLVTGTLRPGQRERVTYAVTVRAGGGNGVLTNYLRLRGKSAKDGVVDADTGSGSGGAGPGPGTGATGPTLPGGTLSGGARCRTASEACAANTVVIARPGETGGDTATGAGPDGTPTGAGALADTGAPPLLGWLAAGLLTLLAGAGLMRPRRR